MPVDLRIIQGDCSEKLKEIPDSSVHTCVTSPPYYGLRDYGAARWEGGADDCGHIMTVERHDYGKSESEIAALPGRNRRSVWTLATAGYPEAHFATYPPRLIRPCVLAGCPAGGVVLDPFAGSGTTGKVALELGRSAILIELNPEYIEMIERRCRVNLPLPFEQ